MLPPRNQLQGCKDPKGLVREQEPDSLASGAVGKSHIKQVKFGDYYGNGTALVWGRKVAALPAQTCSGLPYRLHWACWKWTRRRDAKRNDAQRQFRPSA